MNSSTQSLVSTYLTHQLCWNLTIGQKNIKHILHDMIHAIRLPIQEMKLVVLMSSRSEAQLNSIWFETFICVTTVQC